MGLWVPTRKSREQLALDAAGLLSENVSPFALSNVGQSPSSQLVFGVLRGARRGDIVTGIMLKLSIAAAGTLPTTARFGLADSTGKILVLSGNLNALASWNAGSMPFPFTAPFMIPADGGYYGCFVVNGTWGTTQPTVTKVQVVGANSMTAFGTGAPVGFQWAGQTDLPAINSSLTLTTGLANGIYLALY